MIPLRTRNARLAVAAPALAGLLAAAQSTAARWFAAPIQADPDRYFHLALARLTAAQGLVRSLPFDDIGWERYFPDKEFLFHVLTGLAHALGGEALVTRIPTIAASLILLLLAVAVLPRAPIRVSAAMVALTAALCPHFYFRLLLLRPHLLAMLCFALLMTALFRRRPRLTGVAGLLFSLSYHAWYIPFAALALAFAQDRWTARGGGQSPGWSRSAAFGAVGLAIGILASPYFPSNIAMSLTHLRIATLGAAPAIVRGGAELEPFSTGFYLRQYLVYLMAMAACAAWIGARWRRERALCHRSLLLTTLATGLLALVAISPRATEYAIPCAALALAATLAAIAPPRRSIAALGAIAIGLAFNGRFAFDEYVGMAHAAPSRSNATLLEALDRIPSSDAGRKILNCDWSMGSPTLYERPDLASVDALDPRFLAEANPHLNYLRQLLILGEAPDPHWLVTGPFKARYAMCRDPGGVALLAASADFTQVYPDKPFNEVEPGETYLFKARERSAAAYLRSFDVAETAIKRPPPAGARPFTPAPDWQPLPPGLPYRLLVSLHPGSSGAGWACRLLRPQLREVAGHAGARYLGLGGDAETRVWLNGRALADYHDADDQPRHAQAIRMVNRWVALDKPLRAGDRLEAVVCARPGTRPSVALSLWSAVELTVLCDAKGPSSAYCHAIRL